jgi:hypothetical protein
MVGFCEGLCLWFGVEFYDFVYCFVFVAVFFEGFA